MSGWFPIERPTAWDLIAILRKALRDLEIGRPPELVIEDLRRDLGER